MMNKLLRRIATIAIAILPTIVFAQESLLPQDDLDSKYATELLKPGTMAPAIIVSKDGKQENIIERNKGKYTVLEFWASWCGDCRKDMKHMRRINSTFGSKDVTIQGYSFDKDVNAYNKCRTDSMLVWNNEMSPVQMRESEVAKAYHLNWIPSYYLIDREGRIVLATVMVEKIEEALLKIRKRAFFHE